MQVNRNVVERLDGYIRSGTLRSSRYRSDNLQRSKLRRDSKGLSTLEYVVLFIAILIGAITAWGALGKSISSETNGGREAFDRVLGREAGKGDDRIHTPPPKSSEEPAENVTTGTKKSRSNQYYTPK